MKTPYNLFNKRKSSKMKISFFSRRILQKLKEISTNPFHPKINYFRNLSCILLFICSLLIQGCNWFFHDEETKISELNTYNDFENAINGVYGLLEEKMSNLSFFYPGVKGGDIYEGDANYTRLYDDCKINSRSYHNSSWNDLYKIITSANNIIVQHNSNDTDIGKLIGEAYFIRAYCYFRLTKIFGKIPLIEDIDVKYSIPLSSHDAIYKFIESDLNFACSLLPSNKENARIPGVTIHRGTAKALLAELYLYWGGYPVHDESKYQLSATLAEEVIDSAAFFGFELEEDFANLWKQESLNSKESVFAVFLTNDLYTANSYVNFIVGENRTVPTNYYYNNLSYWATETEFYNTFPKDYRRDITFINDINYTLLDLNIFEYVDYHAYIDSIEFEDKCLKIGYRKFYYDMNEMRDTTIVSENLIGFFVYYYGLPKVYLYRYAHTLLTYAEAAARSGNLTEKAYECLNMIRRRANHVNINSISQYDIQNGLSKKQFADYVVLERSWEFAGEPEGRWFDEIRTGEAGENFFFDIPDEDIDLNPNLEKNNYHLNH